MFSGTILYGVLGLKLISPEYILATHSFDQCRLGVPEHHGDRRERWVALMGSRPLDVPAAAAGAVVSGAYWR